ncbi:MAG: 6,7-dimethyl-8-ribityllumazine synthase [Verrucomicrobiales bacterium]|nr:6,7-dimethyl-8-ribityllumazine synthase [Verrucomicrobiales bacterium]
MLKRVKTKTPRAAGCRFAIVASRYNPRYVDAMLRAARKELQDAGADEVRVVRVPGAFEVPVVAARLARQGLTPWDAVICLGLILRGATVHAEHIGRGVSDALVQLQLETEVPMVHEVLLLENEDQARERCLDPQRNRGREAAQTAIEMARTMRALRR